jgi:hypothetical protein
VEQTKKIGSSACCRGSRAARRRLQQVRLLFRGGDLTTVGSGLGVGVPGSGCSGFAAATHRNPSSGGLACRPDSGVVVLRRGDGLQLHRPAAQQCSSLSPLLFFSPTPSSFLFLHEQRLRDGHGACGMRLTLPAAKGSAPGRRS